LGEVIGTSGSMRGIVTIGIPQAFGLTGGLKEV